MTNFFSTIFLVTPAKDARSRGVAEGDDRAWVDGLRRGDARAFEAVYAAFRPRVHSFLLRLSRQRDVAEDLAQDTFVKLARAAPTLAEDTRLAAWLFTVARNAYVSHRRWAMLDLSRLAVLASEPQPWVRAPDAASEEAEKLVLLERALGAVREAHREVLLLVGVEGLSHEEVATVLGLGPEALRQRLSRARAELTDKMESMSKRPLAAKAARGEAR